MHNPFNDGNRLQAIRAAAELERADYLLLLLRRLGHSVAALFNTSEFGRPATGG